MKQMTLAFINLRLIGIVVIKGTDYRFFVVVLLGTGSSFQENS